MGRPSTYTQETADAICARLAEGESLAEVCRADDMPGYSTVKRWETQIDAFRADSLRAREVGCHKMAEDCLAIADDGKNDWMERNGGEDNPGWQFNGEHIQRSRLRIDTRMRLIGKWLPKVYGDKIDLNHAGTIKFDKIESVVVDPQR